MLSQAAAVSLAGMLLNASDARLETFDAPGTTWANTLFSEQTGVPNAYLFVREPLDPSTGAPDTTPPLPINVGGDLEGRYLESGGTAGSGGYAFVPDLPQNELADVTIRGVLAIGNPDPFGSQSGGLIVRASVVPSSVGPDRVDGYTAYMSRTGGTTQATLALARIRSGVITAADIFVSSVPFPVDLANENYVIDLRARGEVLTARLWRVSVVAGTVTTAPIDLGIFTGASANLLRATDTELAAGRVGLRCFARGGNSVLFDDVAVGIPADL